MSQPRTRPARTSKNHVRAHTHTTAVSVAYTHVHGRARTGEENVSTDLLHANVIVVPAERGAPTHGQRRHGVRPSRRWAVWGQG